MHFCSSISKINNDSFRRRRRWNSSWRYFNLQIESRLLQS